MKKLFTGSVLFIGVGMSSLCAEASFEQSFDWEGMDLSVSPEEDFYHYAVGNWIKEAKIPEGHPRWGSINMIRQKNIKKIESLFEGEFAASTPDEKLLENYYLSYQNLELQEKAGLKPLLPLLAEIEGIRNRAELIDMFGKKTKEGFSAFLSLGVGSHPYKQREHLFYIGQAHLNLPDYEIYLEKFDTSINNHQEKREKYLAYVEKILTLMGKKEAKKKAKAIFALEKSLAKHFYTKEDLRDIKKRTNVLSFSELKEKHPFPYETFFKQINIEPQEVNVTNPELLSYLFAKLALEDLETLKEYFSFSIVNSLAPYLGKSFYDTYFSFYGNTLSGLQVPRPLKERAIEACSKYLSDPLGKAYVKNFFTEDKKEKALEMVELIKASFLKKIESLSWMEEPTKVKAKEKIEKMVVLIGYPDEKDWLDFSSLTLNAKAPLVENMLKIFAFHAEDEIARLNQPVNPKEWQMGAQIVNACNVPTQNKIIFPAGILQEPFFTEDPAICFGAFGMVISHEIIHSFDDQGRHFDSQGNQVNWWQEKDLACFEKHAKVIKEQFDSYKITFTDKTQQSVRGQLCLGENIADLGGVIIAYEAFLNYLKKHQMPHIRGFSPEQRFFLGNAQLFKAKATDDFAKQSLNNDPHSPSIWRVNGTFSQVPGFKKAYSLPENCPMVQTEDKQSYMWTNHSQKSVR